MRLRRHIALATLLLVGLCLAASLGVLASRARQDRAAEAGAALRTQERAWLAIQAALTERLPQGSAADHRLALDDAPREERPPRLPPTGAVTGHGLERVGDGLVLVFTRPGPDGADHLPVRMPAERLLQGVAAVTGAVPVLTDLEGRALAVPSGAPPIAGVVERLRGIEPGWRELVAGDRVVSVATVPLTDRHGQVIGARRWVTDVTEPSWEHARDDLLSASALVVFCLALSMAFLLWLCRAFRPLELALAAQAALAEGDLTVELPGQERQDEIGGAVRSLLVFRQSRVALRRRARADAWQRRVRLRFIEAQLGSLAETLDDADRIAMERDLRELLAAAQGGPGSGAGDAAGMDALAIAFRTLAGRVRSQHERLRRLIAEQGDALAARHRADRLEQELTAVATMQARLAPPSIPAETGVAVAGRLIQGAQFGGDFQDFFWLHGPAGRRLAVFTASVRGRGLAAAFLAISARALVRSLMPLVATPGECLARVSDLLLGDNDQRMEITAFLGVIDLRAQVLVAARASAPPPVLLLRPGEAQLLDVPSAAPLALQPRLKVPEVTIDLPARSALVAFSRGVPETALRGAPIGLDGLVALLAGSPGQEPDTVLAHALERLAGPDAVRPGDASIMAARLASPDARDGAP